MLFVLAGVLKCGGKSEAFFQYAGFIWKLMGEMGEMGSVYEQYYTGERVHICAYMIN